MSCCQNLVHSINVEYCGGFVWIESVAKDLQQYRLGSRFRDYSVKMKAAMKKKVVPLDD